MEGQNSGLQQVATAGDDPMLREEQDLAFDSLTYEQKARLGWFLRRVMKARDVSSTQMFQLWGDAKLTRACSFKSRALVTFWLGAAMQPRFFWFTCRTLGVDGSALASLIQTEPQARLEELVRTVGCPKLRLVLLANHVANVRRQLLILKTQHLATRGRPELSLEDTWVAKKLMRNRRSGLNRFNPNQTHRWHIGMVEVLIEWLGWDEARLEAWLDRLEL